MTRNIHRAFTLIEILIVVIVLGLLAAIVVPQFANTTSDSIIASTQSTLSTVRAQIELFKLQHGDHFPEFAESTDGLTAWNILLIRSDVNTFAATSTPVVNGNCGPYFHNPPLNALNNKQGILLSTTIAGTTNGWSWDPNTGQLRAIIPTGWVTGKAPYVTGTTTIDSKYANDFIK
ncbi:MAG: prepilin-type N-terminal cleavage/methylation domain-containing protein [Phycisphaerae bacterium]